MSTRVLPEPAPARIEQRAFAVRRPRRAAAGSGPRGGRRWRRRRARPNHASAGRRSATSRTPRRGRALTSPHDADRRHPRRVPRAWRARRATSASTRTRSSATPASCRPTSPPAPDLEGADDETPRRVQPAAQRDQLRLAAGSRRCASRPGCPASARSRPGCAPAGRGRRGELHGAHAPSEIAARARPGPRARADGPLRAPPQRARRSASTASYGGASPRRAHGGVASRSPSELATLADLARRLALRRAATSRSSSARRSPPPTSRSQGLAPDRRPRPPHAVRRQPRPARAAHRRRPALRRRPRRPHRRRAAARARLARGGRDPRRAPLHAVELLVAAHPRTTTAAALDWVLWTAARGRATRPTRATARRTTAY